MVTVNAEGGAAWAPSPGEAARPAVDWARTSALAVREMLDAAGGFAIANLLRDLGAGVDFDEAFTRRMTRSFADWMADRARP